MAEGGVMISNIDRERRDKDIIERITKHNYSENLYHYTSISSLYGILKNRELWLGNTATMNDKSEVIDFIQKLHNALRNSIDEDKKEECEMFFLKIYERLKTEYPFAACFSQLEDNAAQWERYADNAKGVCIVFNTKLLMSLFYYQLTPFNEVYYEYDITKHRHFEILKEYFNTGILNGFDKENSLIDNVLACGYVHKHKSFSTEYEVRLITLWKHTMNHSSIEYHMSNGRIKKILKVSLDKLCVDENIDFESLIDQIVIGPHSAQSVYELQEYVLSLGLTKLAEKISVSECPLR